MPSAPTYEPIATTTLGSASASIDFTSIGSGYTDLKVILIGACTAGSNINMRFNNDSTAIYSRTTFNADGTSASTNRATGDNRIYTGYSYQSSSPTLIEIDIFSYAGSTNKTCLANSSSDNNGTGLKQVTVGLWRSTSAITQVNLLSQTSTFIAGTTATLYGILKA